MDCLKREDNQDDERRAVVTIDFERLEPIGGWQQITGNRQACIELGVMVLQDSGVSQSWPDWYLDTREIISGHSRGRLIPQNSVPLDFVPYFSVTVIIGKVGVRPTAKMAILVRLFRQ